MKEVKESVIKYLVTDKFAHRAFHLLEDSKITQRLPKGIDMDRFNKY